MMNKDMTNENMMKNILLNKLVIEKMLADKKEMYTRLKTAAQYQKKAVCALLPEGMESHVDVISNELKLMVKEMAAGLVMECVKSAMKDMDDVSEAAESSGGEGLSDTVNKSSGNEKKHGSRKIDIG